VAALTWGAVTKAALDGVTSVATKLAASLPKTTATNTPAESALSATATGN